MGWRTFGAAQVLIALILDFSGKDGMAGMALGFFAIAVFSFAVASITEAIRHD